MSDLANLQDRITAEFGRARRSKPAPSQAAAPADEPHSLEPDDDPDLPLERYPELKPALAGAGLLCSAMILGTGVESGFYFLSAGLAAAGIIGACLMMRDWRSGGRHSLPLADAPLPDASLRAETRQDKRWEGDEATHLLSTLHDALGEIALIREPGGRIVQANAMFGRLTGCPRPEGQTCEALGLTFEETDETDHYRVRIASPSGLRVFDWHDVIVRRPADGPIMRHSLARDITGDLEAHRSLEARQKAEEASRAKSQLLATVSHEIRTPLSGILGMSHLIGQTSLSAEQANYLSGMRQSGHALVQLVDDLLDFSSFEAGRFTLRPTPSHLGAVMESVVEMLSQHAHEKGIEIGATLSADIPEQLDFDAARLRQVLFNVIGNAVKFTRTGGVFVGGRMEGGGVVVRVEDTGPGMSASEQARLFDDFQQAGSDAQRAGGTGLGLAISRRIMEAFGGSLTVSSIAGHGSTFEIRFPAAGGDLPEALSGETLARFRRLAGSKVLVLAPKGPACRAVQATIETLGGGCTCADGLDEAETATAHLLAATPPLTDIIVDHRHAAVFRRLLDRVPALESLPLRRTYLVNPEERGSRRINRIDGYQAWLIRPLRERSLVGVLQGRMKGMEIRDALNDNRPMLRDRQPEQETRLKSGLLLAEDDPVNAFMIRSIIEKAGHAVHVVGDFEALGQALFDAPPQHRLQPTLIVTDINMPGGDGLAMLKRIRDTERTCGGRNVPIIALTSDTRMETRMRLIAGGASTVMAKPADPRALTAEIDRLLAAAKSS